ncbi:MAG: transporter [Marmoricola sp.]|nr:transporter [Marmoricola sp.]
MTTETGGHEVVGEHKDTQKDTHKDTGGTTAEEHGGKWWPLVAVCVAVFMLLLDITVVNVALPDIQRDLHASFDSLQWVIDAYALTLAAFQLITGVLGDRLGRRSVFTTGVVVFAVSSLGCGLAGTASWLDAFRAVQGIGGAIMFSNSLAILGSTYTGRDRGTAFGIWGATTGASVAIGPLVGGALTTGLGWRWIFFVNLPIAAAAVAIIVLRLPEIRPARARRLDIPGFVLFSAALILGIFGLIRGNDEGWGSAQILTVLGAAALALAVFAVVELRTDEPMLDLRFFRRASFVGAQAAAFGVSASMFGLFLYLTLYLQDVLGYSALGAGLRLLPISALAFVAAPIAGKFSDRVPFRIPLGAGLLIVAVGLVLMTRVNASSSWTVLLPGFLLAGVGIGMVNAPLGSLSTLVVPKDQPGVGAGINNTFRQVGIATAVAAYGSVFQSTITSELRTRLGDRMPISKLSEAVSSGALSTVVRQVPQQARGRVRSAAEAAFVAGLDRLFVIGAVVAGVGALLCVVLVSQRGDDRGD